jgi:hypothetical protein
VDLSDELIVAGEGERLEQRWEEPAHGGMVGRVMTMLGDDTVFEHRKAQEAPPRIAPAVNRNGENESQWER